MNDTNLKNIIREIPQTYHTFPLPGKPRNSYHFFRQRDVAGFRGFKLRVKFTATGFPGV